MFKTNDTILISYLTLIGFNHEKHTITTGFDKNGEVGQQVYLYYDETPELQEAIMSFASMEARVEPQSFIRTYKNYNYKFGKAKQYGDFKI
jgi:hypothetical protein